MVAQPAISIEGVSFAYGSLQVLFDVNAHVDAGEALALVGTNGAGKSTLLRIVAGLAAPSKGRVLMNGQDITGEPAEQLVRRGVVLVEGGRSVFADMTVAENLEVQSLTLRSDRKLLSQRHERVFRTFPALTDRLSQKAGTLSGGEQQQLALAKAILLNPQVLCIDELSLGLAPVVVQELLGIVKSIHDEGTTVILVEQSLNIAADICERALFMEKGAVRFEGRTRDLLERDDIARAVFLGSA
jgi:ABC-type branched-subunit amino acid transport system ATPase component